MSELESRFMERRQAAANAEWQRLVTTGAAKDFGDGAFGTLDGGGDEPATPTPVLNPRDFSLGGADSAAPAAQPSAVGTGAQAGGESIVEGARNFNEGMTKLLLPAMREDVKGPGDLARAAKQVFDGLLAIGLAPFVALGAGARQALENQNPELARTTLITGTGAMGIRGLLAGKALKDLPPAEQHAMAQPMTVAEALDVAVQVAAPVLGPKGVAKAQQGHQAALKATQKTLVGAGIGGVIGEGVPGKPPKLPRTRVVDPQGQPRRVYHGTSAQFSEFSTGKSTESSGPGLYFTESPDVASRYALGKPAFDDSGRILERPNVHAAYLDIRNPLDIGGGVPNAARIAEAKAAGHDGITYVGGARSGSEPHRVWVAFDPAQVVEPFRRQPAQDGGTARVNLPRIDASADAKRIITHVDKLAQQTGTIDSATRGTRTHAQTEAAATAAPMTVADVLGRQPGEVWNAEQQTAARNLRTAAAEHVVTLKDRALDGDVAAARDLDTALDLLLLLNAQDVGAGAETARALEARKIPSRATRQGITEADLRRIGEQRAATGLSGLELALMLDTLPTDGARRQFSREIVTANRVGLMHMYTEAWINGMVSGMAQVRSAVGNFWNNVFAVPTRALGALNAKFYPGGEVTFGETAMLARGQAVATLEALRTAGRAFATNREQLGRGALEERRKYITAANLGLNPERWYGRGLDLFADWIVRMPGRGLMGADQFSKWQMYRGEQHALTYRAALQEHLATGRPFDEVAARLLANPTPDIMKGALDAAERVTMTQEPGRLGKILLEKREEHPVAKLLVPFYTISVNSTRMMGEHTLLGPLWKTVREDLATPGARRDLALARMELGGVMFGSAVYLATQGLVTGKGTLNRDTQKALGDALPPPYSFKIGDTYIPLYMLGQYGLMLGMGADFAELMHDKPDYVRSESALAYVLSFSHTIANQTFLEDSARTIEAMLGAQNNPGKAEAVVRQFGRSQVPAAVAGFERLLDPPQREVHSLMDAIRARTPGLSADLPPVRNIFGEVAYGPGALWTMRPTDLVGAEIQRLGMTLELPPRVIAGKKPSFVDALHDDDRAVGIELNAAEYDFMMQLMGGSAHSGNVSAKIQGGVGLRQRLEQLIASPRYRRQSDGRDGGKALEIRTIVNAYKEAARLTLLDTSTELQGLYERKLTERVNARRPQSVDPHLFMR